MDADVKGVVERVIRAIAEERSLKLPALNEHTELVDELGFSSLMVATLIANLEEAFGVDPFQQEDVMVTDLRTVGDLCEVYSRCLAR